MKAASFKHIWFQLPQGRKQKGRFEVNCWVFFPLSFPPPFYLLDHDAKKEGEAQTRADFGNTLHSIIGSGINPRNMYFIFFFHFSEWSPQLSFVMGKGRYSSRKSIRLRSPTLVDGLQVPEFHGLQSRC